jgi:hypothetical protein
MVEELKKQGLVDELVITDAQGDAKTQIQQIQSMIDADVDAIVVIAGSSNGARPRHFGCLRQGHRRHQLRQPRRHRQGDGQDQHRFQRMGRHGAAKWLIEQARRQGQDHRPQRPGRHFRQR